MTTTITANTSPAPFNLLDITPAPVCESGTPAAVCGPVAVCPPRKSRKGCRLLRVVAAWPKTGTTPARRVELLTDGDPFGAPSAIVRSLVASGATVDTYRDDGMRVEWCSRRMQADPALFNLRS